MQLENRVFSNDEVQAAAGEYVCVKVDPRETQDAAEYKSTRYVPEVVLISSDGERIATLDPKSPEDVVETLDRVAAKERKKK